MTYKQALDFMFSQLPMFHRVGKAAYKANLDNTQKLDHYFGNPHTKFKTIHVAGTNGKGSVSHMIAAVLQAAGYKTGLYTSPHLIDFRERIKINGDCIPEEYITEFINNNLQILEEVKPSFFEMTVALAFNYFASQSVDVAVIEVGLGGRLDSTNIILPEVSVITNISFDHTDLLGNTLSEIAGEKAGIIKKNVPVIIGESNAETKAVFIDKANQQFAHICFADELFTAKQINADQLSQCFNVYFGDKLIYKNLVLDLIGDYQVKNIVTVACALEKIIESGLAIKENAIYEGLKNAALNTGLQGRWQIMGTQPLIVCDTGHNSAGISFVVHQLEKMAYKKLHFIFGVVNDKDIDSVLALLPKFATYYFTKASIPRALDENVLAEKALQFNLHGKTFSTVKSAVEDAKKIAAENDLIFIGGSTFVVADFLSL